jgi:membrane fusion protein, multidrug efflux system
LRTQEIQGKQMTLINVFQKLLAGLFVVFILSYEGCHSKTNNNAVASGTIKEALAVPVEVTVPEEKSLSVTKTYAGAFEGEEQANIVSKISERVTSINRRVGESVRAGQVLIVLDKNGTSSQFYQTKANLDNARKNLARAKSLYEGGAIALQSLDAARTEYEVTKANFESARNAVELTTPIVGVVTALNVSVGDIATPGAVLMTIAKIDHMKVIFNIDENDVPNISIGEEVQVRDETNAKEKVEGRIIQLSKSADPRSRSFEIKALFPNTSTKWFKPGMFGSVNVTFSSRQETIVVPNAAIQSDGVTSRVFVVRDGQAFGRAVTVGITNGQQTEILGGLTLHDTVVTVGVNNLKDSSFVNEVSR